MAVFNHPDFDAHESVHFVQNAQAGLKAIIAVHSRARGPACGGCRIWPYDTDALAITDALRLSSGMSYKSAMAGLDLGGGKCVVMKPDGPFDRAALFQALGREIQKLGGVYIAAADVGIQPGDLEAIKTQTNFIGGLPVDAGGSGDSSPVTADGVYRGIRAAATARLGSPDLTGLTVALQGVGNVGMPLCAHLHAAGAKLIVTDINKDAVAKAVSDFGAQAVPLDEIYDVPADIFSPCALGKSVNPDTLSRFTVKIIAGAANNQLSTPDMGEALTVRGILYAPDYVINAGGIINIASEFTDADQAPWVNAKLDGLENTLSEIFETASQTGKAPGAVADALARMRIGAVDCEHA